MRDVDWLIAPDSFKGTLAAREVALAIAAGAARERADAQEAEQLELASMRQAGELAGHRVLAVEPLPEMRAILSSSLPDVQALAGTAKALPLADASVDAERPGHWPAVEDLREDYVEVEDREFQHEQLIARAGLRDLASSRSRLALLPAHRREQVLAGLDRLWEREPELSGRTQALLPWRTRVRRCSRLR